MPYSPTGVAPALAHLPDEALLALARQADSSCSRAARWTLLARHLEAVYRELAFVIARHRLQFADVEDLCQEVLLGLESVFPRYDSARSGGGLLPYLKAAAGNRARDWLRDWRRRRGRSAGPVNLDCCSCRGEDPVEATLAHERTQVVQGVLSALPDDARRLAQRHADGRSLEELAEALAVSDSTAKRLWRRLRATLAARLDSLWR